MAPPTGDMPPDEFRRIGHEMIDWIADYWINQERYRVTPDVKPGELIDKLPLHAPDQPEGAEAIFQDFLDKVLPHCVHWNHPGFMAYFAAGGSAPGVLAETLTAALNNVGLLWKATPALHELEQTTLGWLAQWLDLPREWFGIIHETASDATFHAAIAARQQTFDNERAAGREPSLDRMVMYTSEHAHSSVEKAMLALGRPREACRKIATDANYAMRPDALADQVRKDRGDGLLPIGVTATIGTTSSTAVDPVPAIADIAELEGLWLHVDSAYAGPCMMLPELRHYFAGVERADSFVMNPHKWLWAPMGCSALYTAKPEVFRRALSLTPEYLRSQQDPRAVNFMEYAVPLGRRNRALKLFFILRYFGKEGVMARLREHIRLAADLTAQVDAHPDFELMAPTTFSLVCLRYNPAGVADPDAVNQRILDEINASGEFFLSHTKLDGKLVIRVAIGNLRTAERHVERLWDLLQQTAATASPPRE